MTPKNNNNSDSPGNKIQEKTMAKKNPLYVIHLDVMRTRVTNSILCECESKVMKFA